MRRSSSRRGPTTGSGCPSEPAYLTEASSSLRAAAIPVVAEIVKANEARAQKEFDRSNSSIQLLAGVAALIVLVLIAVWLARRTHRYLNPSLTGGVVLLVVGLFVAATTIGNIGTTTAEVASGLYRDTVDLAHVRTAANDARANESLTLIARGSGKAYEDAWVANDKTVRETLGRVASASSLTNGWDALCLGARADSRSRRRWTVGAGRRARDHD